MGAEDKDESSMEKYFKVLTVKGCPAHSPLPFSPPTPSGTVKKNLTDSNSLSSVFREAYYDWFHHGLTEKKNPLGLPIVSAWSHCEAPFIPADTYLTFAGP